MNNNYGFNSVSNTTTTNNSKKNDQNLFTDSLNVINNRWQKLVEENEVLKKDIKTLEDLYLKYNITSIKDSGHCILNLLQKNEDKLQKITVSIWEFRKQLDNHLIIENNKKELMEY